MNVDVIVNGRQWTVAVEPAVAEGQLTVTIEGVSRAIDASWIDSDTLSLVDGSAAHEIRFHRRDEQGVIGVEIGGTMYEAIVAKRGREGFAFPSGQKNPAAFSLASGGSKTVKSPMPGRVVRVLVAIGDRVTARQGVVVVEAMKMENELRTPTDGVVKEILVAPGAAVETGAVLVIVEQ